MISLLFALVTSSASAAPLRPYWHNELGLGYLGRGDKLNAYKEFNRAIELDPLNPKLQFNLAITFEANEEWEKAESTYNGVLEVFGKNPGVEKFSIFDLEKFVEWRDQGSLEAVTYFNLGNVLGAQKKIPEALRAYQNALDRTSKPPEKGELATNPRDIKKNIELLFAKGGGQGDGKGKSDQNDPNNKDKKDQDKDKKDDKTNQQKREESLKQPQPDQNKDKDKEKKAKPFQSQELGPDDVKRILDEIKNQEQNIRAQEYDKKPKDGARGGKDW